MPQPTANRSLSRRQVLLGGLSGAAVLGVSNSRRTRRSRAGGAEGATAPASRRVHPRGGLRRSVAGRGGALDPPRPRSTQRRRDAGPPLFGAVAGGERRAVHPGGPGGERLRCPGGCALGACRGERPAAGAGLLLPVPIRTRAQPGGAHQDRAAAGGTPERVVLRLRLLPGVHQRLVHRLPPNERGGPGPGGAPGRLHL